MALIQGDCAFVYSENKLYKSANASGDKWGDVLYEFEGSYAWCKNPEGFHFLREGDQLYLTEPENKQKGPLFFEKFQDKYFFRDIQDPELEYDEEVFLHIEDGIVFDEEGEFYYFIESENEDSPLDDFPILVVLAHILE